MSDLQEGTFKHNTSNDVCKSQDYCQVRSFFKAFIDKLVFNDQCRFETKLYLYLSLQITSNLLYDKTCYSQFIIELFTYIPLITSKCLRCNKYSESHIAIYVNQQSLSFYQSIHLFILMLSLFNYNCANITVYSV